MKLTKWFFGALLAISLMFAVGCSDDDKDSGGGGWNITWNGTFTPKGTTTKITAKAVISKNNEFTISGDGFDDISGKIINIKEHEGMQGVRTGDLVIGDETIPNGFGYNEVQSLKAVAISTKTGYFEADNL